MLRDALNQRSPIYSIHPTGFTPGFSLAGPQSFVRSWVRSHEYIAAFKYDSNDDIPPDTLQTMTCSRLGLHHSRERPFHSGGDGLDSLQRVCRVSVLTDCQVGLSMVRDCRLRAVYRRTKCAGISSKPRTFRVSLATIVSLSLDPFSSRHPQTPRPYPNLRQSLRTLIPTPTPTPTPSL